MIRSRLLSTATHIAAMLSPLVLGPVAVAQTSAPVTVVEYYNATLDAYFITGRTAEQTTLDALPADFRRTGMQFAFGVVGVMHAVHAQAQLEPQPWIVAQRLRHHEQAPAPDVQGHLVAVDHHLLDGVVVGDPALSERVVEGVGDLVEVPAVRARRGTGQRDRRDQSAVARRVAGTLGAEQPSPDTDHLTLIPGHRSSPVNSMVGFACSAAFSAAQIARSRSTPSGISWIC